MAIAGYAQSPVLRHSAQTLGALTVETARRAIADAGLTLAQVDGFTDPDGKFTTFLLCTDAGTKPTEITAFVEGATGVGTCQCGFPTTPTPTPTGTSTP